MSNKAKHSVLICFVMLLLLLPPRGLVHTQAQSGGAAAAAAAAAVRPEQFVIPLHGEGFIAFKIEAAPPANGPRVSTHLDEIQSALTPQVLLADNHVVHRVLVDAGGKFVFGYDLVVEPIPATKQFKVSVNPLSAEFETQLRARQPTAAAGGTAGGTNRAQEQPQQQQSVSTLPRPTEAQLIDDGDAFALDLLVNPQTGVKIMDVVKVSFDRARLWSEPRRRGGPPRDFTLGNVELAVREHKLMINGELVGGGGKPARGCAGALVWFYVPGRGRFIFSLIPHEGYDFQKVGRIEDNKIFFTLGADVYEWTSSAPVVGSSSGGGNWNLWVLHDAGYVSDFDSPEQIAAGVEANPPASEWLQDPLSRLRRDRRAEFEARDDKAKRAVKRPRVLVGGADRIENLLPKR